MKRSLIALAAIALIMGTPAISQVSIVSSHAASSPSLPIGNSTTSTPQLLERNPRYTLRKGDSFDLTFDLSPEFNQSVAVEPDGFITLRDVGSIFVEGQTVPQVTDTVKTAYAKILHNPIVSITLKDFEKPYFIAAGQVGKPGKYDLRSDLTVTEAVAIAGGFDDRSKHSEVVLFRPLPGGGFKTTVINVKHLLASRDLSEDIHIQPGDMLYVPQNTLSKIRPFLPAEGMGAYYTPGMF